MPMYQVGHVAPGLQEAAANRFDELVNPGHGKETAAKSH